MTRSRQWTNKKSEKKPVRIRRYMQTKLAFAFVVVALALFALSVRILLIVANKGEDYSKIVLTQQNYESSAIPFRRGTITDRNQTVLAASEQVYNLILDSKVMEKQEDVDATIQALVTCLGYNAEDLRTKLSVESTASYIRYARELTLDQKNEFESYKEAYNKDSESVGTVRGVWFEMEYKRVYPYSTLGCTVLGFSGQDSTKGNWGIEQYYNDYLTGINGRSYGFLNTDGTVERTTKAAMDGATIITTLDFTIQKAVEDLLAEFNTLYTTKNVGVLVMNPNNSEILAMATGNSYDLNHPADLSDVYTDAEVAAMNSAAKSELLTNRWRNFMISDAYEPGSTAKAFTVAAALEENLATWDDRFICDGGQQLSKDRYVKCAHYHGEVNLKESLAYSCNDAMMQLGSMMGKNIFSSYQELFGLGHLTGIDLPGESAGLLYPVDKMSVVDLGTNTFGQNYNVTMVQMAAAYASILNGGNYYQPHIVKQILSANGEVLKDVGTNVVRETVSESTSQIIRESLQMCVEADSDFATGRRARISGYTVGGKTGTAEKYPRGQGRYLLSFVGFAPAEDPQVLVYVVVDEPVDLNGQNVESASIAVKLEQKVMKAISTYMNLSSTGAFFNEPENDLFVPPVPLDENGNPILQETDENGNPIQTTNPEEEEDPSQEGQESSENSPEDDSDAEDDEDDDDEDEEEPEQPIERPPVYSDLDQANGDEKIPEGGFVNTIVPPEEPKDEDDEE